MRRAITARVGVTERTFFLYFASKRDVLFDEDAMQAGLVTAIAEAPDGLSPMELVRRAFASLIPLFERNRFVRRKNTETLYCSEGVEEAGKRHCFIE